MKINSKLAIQIIGFIVIPVVSSTVSILVDCYKKPSLRKNEMKEIAKMVSDELKQDEKLKIVAQG